MTEVPEHLLKRSRDRRAAIGGGGGGDAGSGAPAASGEEPGTGLAATASDSTEVAAAAAAPAVVEEAPPPPPPPPYVQAALARPKIPRFAIPVLAALPLWALIYAGTLTTGGGDEFADPQLALGAQVYSANCASCHGNAGQGGAGRPLDEVIETFPEAADHVAWVEEGSNLVGAGNQYGANGRVSQSDGYGPMPGFGGALSAEEIAAVVRYERVEFGGEAADAPVEGGGEDTGEAENEGGDVGGDSAEGSGDSAAPSDEGDGETQPESEATDEGGQNETDAGSGTGGTPGG